MAQASQVGLVQSVHVDVGDVGVEHRIPAVLVGKLRQDAFDESAVDPADRRKAGHQLLVYVAQCRQLVARADVEQSARVEQAAGVEFRRRGLELAAARTRQREQRAVVRVVRRYVDRG